MGIQLQDIETEIRMTEDHIRIEFNIDPHFITNDALLDLSHLSFELFKFRQEKERMKI